MGHTGSVQKVWRGAVAVVLVVVVVAGTVALDGGGLGSIVAGLIGVGLVAGLGLYSDRESKRKRREP